MKGKLIIIIVIIVTLLSISGQVKGGTEKAPEITDPEGDAPDRVSGENVPHLDIMAAWFHNETTTHIEIALKFSNLTHVANPVGTTLAIRRIAWQYDNSKKPDLWWFGQVETTDNIHKSYFTYYLEGNQTRRNSERGCRGSCTDTAPGVFVFEIEKDNIGSPMPNTTLINIYCETLEARQTQGGRDWLFHLVDNTTYGNDYTITDGPSGSDNNKPIDDNNSNFTSDDEEKDSGSSLIPGFSGFEVIIIMVIIIEIIRKRCKTCS
jgi:hypothetical protein